MRFRWTAVVKCALPVIAIILLYHASPAEGRSLRREERGITEAFQKAKGFLQDYGWLPKWNPENFREATGRVLRKVIKKFQRFFGLRETGELDIPTVTLMNSPRCGVEDNMQVVDAQIEAEEGPDPESNNPNDNSATMARRKRYIIQDSVLQGQKWQRRDLKYRVTQYSSKIDRATVDGVFRKAFFEWEKAGPFNITLKPDGPVHIDIKFAPGDGPGKALAYAYGPGPGIGGDMRFDEYEDWTVRSASGQNLYMVALHEIGHTFGLDHSNVKGAIMNPYYSGYVQGKSLQPDDIAGIQAIYGPRTQRPAPPAAPTAAKMIAEQTGRERRGKLSALYRDVCNMGENEKVIDGVTITEDRRVYAFKGKYFFELSQDSSRSQPEPISQGWVGLPETIDTVFTGPEGYTFFFKGDQVYRFKNRQMQSGYPRPISQAFPGVPSNLDAVFFYLPNRKIYFIKGGQYYRFEAGTERRVADGYPKNLSEWKKLPGHIDAAVMWRDGRTYFFAGKNYYKFNDAKFAVEDGYPKPTASWWFSCPEETSEVEAATESPV
ncbi:matrix metalloproteinase-14-like [Paramacrobiotus metropolitanus]|uniref:matrix metalloproteinase-14-like n=1 Tax=Paramacrobiotus metropolitanus TaxID=2943436 RepID=UPI002445E6F7|nr:matrix metalloproteinase-14-like [Paramacrobiotus metropolitanus]